ncbi:MAG: biotin/lipoate A/B protein ligase family protein [Micrococcales bacterium]
MDYSAKMLAEVAENPVFGAQVQVYAPHKTVAFSRRESFMPGFEEAQQAARDLGYEPIIRNTGGRAVAYDPTSLVFDIALPEPTLRYTNDFIFKEVGSVLVAMLRAFKIDARLGEVPGEYCPGKFSINARDEVKLIGTSQRAMPGARLVSGSLLLTNTDETREVLTQIYAAMNFDWNPATVASVEDEIGSVDQATFKSALTQELRIFGEHLFRKDYF